MKAGKIIELVLIIIVAAITAALMAAGAIGGTIAYFTSESKTTASIEAGVVRMSMEARYSLYLTWKCGGLWSGKYIVMTMP